MPKINKLLSILSLVLTDIAALFVSFLIAYLFRSTLLLPIIPGFKQIEPLPLMPQLYNGFMYGALVIILVFLYEKLYARRLTFWEEARDLLQGVTISFILIMVLVFVSRTFTQYSRAVIVLTWIMSLIFFPLFRLVAKEFLVKSKLWKKKVIILGTKDLAELVAQGIKRNRLLGYEVVGFLIEDKTKAGQTLAEGKILGDLTQLEELARQSGVKDVIIALPDHSQQDLINVIETCESFAESIRIVPNIGSLFTLGVVVDNLGDVSALSVARNLVKPWNILIKNIFELILTVILFILLLPLLLIIALAIKLDSPGSIIFTQERLGKKARPFKFFKFRSMYVDCEARLEKFLAENPTAQKEWEQFQKIKGIDPRVTKVGKFLRKYSLDELPQIINFFKGDMNLVGPRPYMPRELIKIGKRSQIISRVKPGITGLWQVQGRNLLPFYKRILMDEYYIRNWSLWMDIVILVKTIKVFLTGEGAF